LSVEISFNSRSFNNLSI